MANLRRKHQLNLFFKSMMRRRYGVFSKSRKKERQYELSFPTEAKIYEMLLRIIISILLLTLIVLLSYWQKIKMEKVFIWSFTRGFAQILLMATALIIIFELKEMLILYGVLFINMG